MQYYIRCCILSFFFCAVLLPQLIKVIIKSAQMSEIYLSIGIVIF